MKLQDVTLDDKYAQESGLVYLSGVQALTRALLNQRRRDQRAALDTAGFVSGYRGSPLGTFDKELWRAQSQLSSASIRFVPGVNEELAANAVAGSQQVGMFPGARHQGVFALWYAKGPGVDRSGDVLRHANLAGTAGHGGVLLACGDDHAGVSTTTNHQSDLYLRALQIPMLLPADVQDVLDLAIHGWAMSRYTGLFVGFKALADVVEASARVEADPQRVSVEVPRSELPPGGLNLRWPDDRFSQERRLHEHKLPALAAYIRANKLNRITLSHPRARLGIVASGKAYAEVVQALRSFGLGDPDLLRLGLRLCKVSVPWPLERESAHEFATGLEEILVVEEKEPLIEPQLRDLLYGVADRARPRVLGKTHAPDAIESTDGAVVRLPVSGDLDSSSVANVLGAWLLQYEEMPVVRQRLARLREKARAVRAGPPVLTRAPYYCSGCPHSQSTKVPDGSLALAGVGCHYLALSIYPEQTRTFTVMGTEGSNWIGIAPFTDTRHAFVNLGEGSYFHSSILAIRAAVAASINVTYRLLYNDAVAMTGGQPVDGTLTVAQLVQQLQAEGVARVMVVAETLELGREELGLAEFMRVYPRTALDEVQRTLRATPGCTALVYVQTCAAEKRRRRKRGRFPEAGRHVVINAEVCEGCGDCGRKSNCVSVVPRPTELGVKRAIDQSNCNQDFSCIDGFCPSFVTVRGARLRRPAVAADDLQRLPPDPPRRSAGVPRNILITGIGGTGVMTIGAVLGMAAHLQGWGVSVLDMTGMAQKNGGVQSHVRLTPPDTQCAAPARIPAAGADLLLACDLLEGCSPQALDKLSAERTRVVANVDVAMPGAFAQRPEDFAPSVDGLRAAMLRHVRADNAQWFEATKLAVALTGSAIGANLLLLGAAYQAGELPLAAAAIERAIELNGVSVQASLQAFRWGRRMFADPQAALRVAFPERSAAPAREPRTPAQVLQALQEDRSRRLVEYQAAYSRRYQSLVDRVRRVDEQIGPGTLELTTAVARNYYKLLAIKDEYEVARQLTSLAFCQELAATFEGRYSVEFHLAPPLWARRDARTGEPRKRTYGAWLAWPMRLLARMRWLRGTAFDVFGWSGERRAERRLIQEFEELVQNVCARLQPASYATAVQLVALTDRVRGFGHVKLASMKSVAAERERLLAKFP